MSKKRLIFFKVYRNCLIIREKNFMRILSNVYAYNLARGYKAKNPLTHCGYLVDILWIDWQSSLSGTNADRQTGRQGCKVGG